jgi:hypothetical protein
MTSPKYLDVTELAEITNVKEDFIIELCCVERIPFLGVPIDPIFKMDELDQLKEIIQQKGEKS